MRCPYCAEDIKNNALVCKHCRRDFFIVRHLLTKVRDASDRIDLLEAKLIAAGIDPESDDLATVKLAPFAEKTATAAAALDDRIPTLSPWLTGLISFLLLIAAHYLIVIRFDMDLIYLRMVSIGVPLTAAFFGRAPADRRLRWDLGMGVLLAVCSIAVMSEIVAKIDGVPLFPVDAQGWRELRDYATSIAFGFFTGRMIRYGLTVARSPSARASFVVELVFRWIMSPGKGKDDKPADDIDKQLKRVQAFAASAVAGASVIISLYTGIARLAR